MRCALSGSHLPLAVTLALTAGMPIAVRGQANFVETFDDLGPPSYSRPPSLLQRGWTFVNQSQPLGSRDFYPGTTPNTNPIYFWPQAGAGYLAIDGATTNVVSGGEMSAWAILPPIANQQAGDGFQIWLRGLGGAAGVEIRHSPSGGTNTGAGPTEIGDFTDVVLVANPVSSAGWTEYQGVVPGTGRLAIRYVGTFGGLGNFSPYVGIDTLSVGPPPGPPCNLPPIPQPGQTAMWTLANSPYTVCQNITIPAGATVNVEAGVTVNFDSQRQLSIAGVMNIQGTAASPVTFTAPGIFPPFMKVQYGTLEADFADFGQQLRISEGANVRLRDCTFTSDGTNLRGGMLTSDSLFGPATPYVLLERCTFTQSLCVLSDCLAVLRDNTFNQSTAWLLRGFADVTAPNTFIGQPLEITREEPIQPALVDGVNATGVSQGGGLRLDGGNWLLGPGTQLTGNDFPLSLSGGLMPGSTVTLTGNINNAIDVGNSGFVGDGRWIKLPIPYRLTESAASGGMLRIEPGVRVEGDPGIGMFMAGGRRVRIRGTPEEPIVFQPTIPGQHWYGMVFDTNFHAHPHLENCIFREATLAVVGVDTVDVRVDHCRFESNLVGTSGNFNTQITIGKSLFTGNAIGARRNSHLFSFTNPNAFEGNAAAVEGNTTGTTHAELVWWNSPTGPSGHPQNPAGTGDPLGQNPGSVSIFPFLTQRPNFADTPPIVRILDPGIRGTSQLDPGEKFILQWEAADDAEIVSQTVTVHGGEFGPFTLAENLPGSQRSLEITIPSVGFEVVNTPQRIRIEVTDSAGQTGRDQFLTLIPSGRLTGQFTFSPATLGAYVGQTFIAAQELPGITFSGQVSQFPSIDLYLVLDADAWYIPGYANSQYQYGTVPRAPHASTDLARLALRARNNANDQLWFYTDYFSIRHDPRLGFEPPQVQMLTPAHGGQYPGGGIVPITWTASAQQGLYSFDIQASFDGGVDWQVIARDLPATATSYDWRLPSSDGLPDVRVRVIARDRRGQNSSSGRERIFSIVPGTGPSPCYANCDGSTTAPILNVADFSCFLQKFAAGESYANCDGSTTPPVLNVADFSCFLQKFAAGCR